MAAEGCMNHHMSASVFVKESLDDYLFLSRHYSQRQFSHREVLDDLFSRAMTDADDIDEPVDAGSADVLVRITLDKLVRNLSS